MTIANDLRLARAGLETLLADATPDSPPELREKVIELAMLVRSTYRNGEWELLTAEIRAKFGIDVADATDDVTQTRPLTATDSFVKLVEDGWFLDYLEYTQESEAPSQFHFGAILTCASAAFGRRPLIGWEAAPLYTNIYSLLVGPTGTRKSTALAKARELIALAFPKVGSTPGQVNILPNEGSPQGYASALRRRNFEVTTLSDGLIVASELTVLVGREQYKAALGEWLTDWYDNMTPIWSRALKGEETYELIAPYVCFAGASNMTWLREIPENLIKAGYLPRHLVFTASEKRRDMANPQFAVAARDRLATLLRDRVRDLPVTLPLGKAAVTYMEDWYLSKVTRQERAEQDELFAAWLSRKLPHALKVATVWQIVDGGPRDELHVDWLRRASRLVDWMDSGVLTVYHALGSSTEGAITDVILSYIERKGGKATVSAVIRGLRNKYSSRSTQEGIKTLLLARVLTQTIDPINPVQGTLLTVVDAGGGRRG